jgi:iron complex transport system ATP-binding protein
MKLEVRGVCFSYGSRPILTDVTLGVKKGEIVSIVGPNGSGKTTLLKCIDKMLKPKKGCILVKNQDLGKLGIGKVAKLLGYVPQSAVNSLPSTVFEAILIGRSPHLSWRIGKKDRQIVSEVLELMGIKDMALRQFNQLSGGERQKVLIGKALAQEPEVILLDEPTSNLDLRHQLEVLDILTSMVEEKGISMITAMHDLNLALRFSHKIVALKEGRICAAGEPASVLTSENIRSVYGVEAVVSLDSGRPYIVPLRPVYPEKGEK